MTFAYFSASESRAHHRKEQTHRADFAGNPRRATDPDDFYNPLVRTR